MTPAGSTYGHAPHRRRALLIVTAALLVLPAGAAAAVIRPSATVPDETYVAGVAVGGLDDTDVRAALEGPVRDKVEQPVRIEVGDERIEVRPADVGIRLDADATRKRLGSTRLRFGGPGRRDLRPTLAVDQAAARAALEARLGEFRQAARNRTVRLAAPAVVLDEKGDASYSASSRGVATDPGAPGRAVDTQTAVRALTDAVQAGSTSVKLQVTEVAPGDDTPKLAGVDQLIGTFTTYHACCAPRVTNIHRIAELVDGTVIAPGAKFSLNDTAGERTAARGFVAAPAIVDGELEDQLGGGVSQFSTTLFNAAWFAGVDIVEHQPHSLYITRYPPGREATLDWRSIDQVIRNDTAAPIVIRVRTTDTSITIGLYGHTGERKVTSVTGPRQGQGTDGGFRVAVTRTIRDSDAEAGTDTISWTYRGLD